MPGEFEIYGEAVSVLVGATRSRVPFSGSDEQRFLEELRVLLMNVKGCKHSRFVSPARMVRIQNILSQFRAIDNRTLTVRELHRIAAAMHDSTAIARQLHANQSP